MQLWLKAFHVIFVISWFAGLFYLPRIFVNLAMVPADSSAERERLLLMAGKLYRFMTPLGVIALVVGVLAGLARLVWLWLLGRLAACQNYAGAGTDRLSFLLRSPAGCIRRRTQHAEPCLVPLFQRIAGADYAGHRAARYAQAILNL